MMKVASRELSTLFYSFNPCYISYNRITDILVQWGFHDLSCLLSIPRASSWGQLFYICIFSIHFTSICIRIFPLSISYKLMRIEINNWVLPQIILDLTNSESFRKARIKKDEEEDSAKEDEINDLRLHDPVDHVNKAQSTVLLQINKMNQRYNQKLATISETLTKSLQMNVLPEICFLSLLEIKKLKLVYLN